MTEYKTFDDYVIKVLHLEPTELTHISPEEQKTKMVKMSVDELITIWNELTEKDTDLKELKKELEQAKKVKVVEHFEAYGQCRDSRRIANLEAQVEESKEIIREFLNLVCIEFPCSENDDYEEIKAVKTKAEAFMKEE